MSTWQIFSDAGNSYRWEVSGRIIRSKPQDDPNIAPNEPLPSMADLLFQGCMKLLENGERGDSMPVFRTGLGKSVVVKDSSIERALSVIGNDEEINSDAVLPTKNGHGYSGSLFQTGSGKKVNVSSAGIFRARALLGLEEDNAPCGQHGFQNPTKLQIPNDESGWQDSSCFGKSYVQNFENLDLVSAPKQPLIFKSISGRNKTVDGTFSIPMPSKMFESAPKPPQFKFHTAGGRSLSVSSEALKRARSLLGDPEIESFRDEVSTYDPSSKFCKEIKIDDTSSNKESDSFASFSHQGMINNKDKEFISPLRSHSKKTKSHASKSITSGTNLIEKFEEVGNASTTGLMTNIPTAQKLSSNKMLEPNPINTNSLETGAGSRISSVARSSGRMLTDISNIMPLTHTNGKQTMNEKRRIGRISSASPFKKPRSSKFSTPFMKAAPHVCNGTSTLSSEHSCGTRRISTRYPFHIPRVSLKEYFGVPPSACSMYLSDTVKQIKPDNADKYLFSDESGFNCIGVEEYRDMLAKSGASMQYISKEWITNHYKWIVWKLASYERRYPATFAGKFLTISSVLEELKYRYEREVNYGHRSAIRRILEGDALPSMMMVLCISSICSNCGPKIEIDNETAIGAESTTNFKVEVTDGWYAIEATLDVLLSKQLAAGKLFVGQKLQIWGAGLCGWVGPISPLEASGTVSLLLNINGTYRAHWADRLGFCKGAGAPLAFRCIKSDGGRIPRTLAGVIRIYPVLYRERLSNGRSVVRSERMESKIAQLHNQRCLVVTEGIIAEYQRGINSPCIMDVNDSEGAKIFNILETAAEPEIIMAEMSSEQLASFSSFKAKLEATRQSEMEKSVEAALADAGLNEREVTPFMRVRVVGLSCRNYNLKGRTKEGIITLWNPTEKQKHELVEGHAYTITGLIPLHSVAETLYLQAGGSKTRWQALSPPAAEHFQPFFTPRKSISLSNLHEIPISSEFDIAAFIVYVGETYSDTLSCRKKQWVFVTDDSASDLQSESLSKSLLAICFCSYMEDDSFELINSNLVGSTVGFCNLVKKANDWINHVWVAEATENSTYLLKFDSRNSHLKNAAASVQMWANVSTSIIDRLREKVLFIINNSKG